MHFQFWGKTGELLMIYSFYQKNVSVSSMVIETKVLTEFPFKFMTRSVLKKITQLMWLYLLHAVLFYDYISSDLTW